MGACFSIFMGYNTRLMGYQLIALHLYALAWFKGYFAVFISYPSAHMDYSTLKIASRVS